MSARIVPIEARLKRLRVVLTAVFATALALGLLVLAGIAISTDSRSRADAIDATMTARTAAASRLIYYSAAGDLRLDGLTDDDATVGSPEILVMRGRETFAQVFRSRGPHLPLTRSSLDETSRRAVETEQNARIETRDRTGEEVVLIATPFYDPAGRAAGAVVSATSTAPSAEDHRQLVVAMAAGCGILLLLAAGAGWILAGRSLRPAAAGMAQQEALLADAAHELRNPIASIQSVLEGAELDPATRESAIRTALESSRRMGDTVEALLVRGRVQSRAESVRKVPMRVDQMLEDLRLDLPPDVSFSYEGGQAVIDGDPALVRIALRNLLDNAVRHGVGGDGTRTIDVAVDQGRVTVSDRGPGPPPIGGEGFHRYREGSPGGSGLGISIAAWIAEVHGGSLQVSERPGGGTSATLDLGAGGASGGA